MIPYELTTASTDGSVRTDAGEVCANARRILVHQTDCAEGRSASAADDRRPGEFCVSRQTHAAHHDGRQVRPTAGAAAGVSKDSDGLLLIASNYGNPRHPAWYWNLGANPKVEVLAGKDSGTYIASEITDPAERERAWDLALDIYAGYADYESRAGDRTIPLIHLKRLSG